MDLNHPDLQLELNPHQMRQLIDSATRRIVQHISSLPEQPAAYSGGGQELVEAVREENLPDRGSDLEELLELIFDRLAPQSFNTASPGYLAYIPGGGLFHSAVADLIANALNRYVGVWIAAPGLVQLEANVIHWFCRMIQYPQGAGGLLTSGGSLANLIGIVTARHIRCGEDFRNATLYVSDQAHHSVSKAARIAGIASANMRKIPTDSHFRIRLNEAQSAIQKDRKKGLQPFLIVGSAGTTNTGAIDDIPGLADLAARENIWFHLDAAYGGFFMLTEAGREKLAGIERADSIVLDPHKGLFLPYGTGSLLVRNRNHLQETYSEGASYMPSLGHGQEFVDFCEISPELSRDFRGLRVWLPLKLHGAQAFRNNLDEKLELTEWIYNRIKEIKDVEIVADPELSLFAFRLAPPGLEEAELNDLNRRLLQEVNRPRNVYLTATELGGRFILRVCILSFRTHLDRVKLALEDIRRGVQKLRPN